MRLALRERLSIGTPQTRRGNMNTRLVFQIVEVDQCCFARQAFKARLPKEIRLIPRSRIPGMYHQFDRAMVNALALRGVEEDSQ